VPEHQYTQPWKWYPNRVDTLRRQLGKFFRPTAALSEERSAAMVNNVAYTLQFLQFLEKVIADLDLTSVLVTQTFKVFIISGCAIVEAIFYQIVSESGCRKKRPTFDEMCKKIERENLIQADTQFYSALCDLRQIRNRVHIFDREGRADTDYLKVDFSDFESMKRILRFLLIEKVALGPTEGLKLGFLDERTYGYP
jgi:hypothetical protein